MKKRHTSALRGACSGYLGPSGAAPANCEALLSDGALLGVEDFRPFVGGVGGAVGTRCDVERHLEQKRFQRKQVNKQAQARCDVERQDGSVAKTLVIEQQQHASTGAWVDLTRLVGDQKQTILPLQACFCSTDRNSQIHI